MTMITPSYLGETIEYSSLHACRSTLEDPTGDLGDWRSPRPGRVSQSMTLRTAHSALSSITALVNSERTGGTSPSRMSAPPSSTFPSVTNCEPVPGERLTSCTA